MIKYDRLQDLQEGGEDMDFGPYDSWKLGFWKGVAPSYVSSDILVYQLDKNGKVQVLVGARQNDPWKNSTTVPMGGYVDDKDVNLMTASLREVEEETGLEVKIEFYVGVYGPERFHYQFDGRNAVKTDETGHVRPVVANVFAGQAVGGKLKDTAEQKGLRWVDPEELAGQLLPFDHAVALADFLGAMRDGSAQTWRREALKLVR